MSWRVRVGVSCWLRYSRCQKLCSKTSGKSTHVAMTTYLHYLSGYRSSRSPIAPHRKSHIFKSDGGRIQHLYIPSFDPCSYVSILKMMYNKWTTPNRCLSQHLSFEWLSPKVTSSYSVDYHWKASMKLDTSYMIIIHSHGAKKIRNGPRWLRNPPPTFGWLKPNHAMFTSVFGDSDFATIQKASIF